MTHDQKFVAAVVALRTLADACPDETTPLTDETPGAGFRRRRVNTACFLALIRSMEETKK